MSVMIVTRRSDFLPGTCRSDDHHAAVSAALVDVAADVDPPQSTCGPHSAPAAVVGGVDKGRADERKPIEAMMEAAVMEAVPEREP
jgi:hypothetical protein